LAQHFLDEVCEEAGKKVSGYTDEAMSALRRYQWPGNVRELQNVVERAVLLGKGTTISPDDLPSHVAVGAPSAMPSGSHQPLKQALGAPERQIILDALQANSWNRNATADALGINRTTLYKKMKRLGLKDPRQTAPSF
jgi:DNA-binding NtrC family response regulator